MQTSLTFVLDNRLPEILDRLSLRYPAPSPSPADPLRQLVYAMVSEGAAASVGLAVFNRLMTEYPSWTRLAAASPEALATHFVGLPNARAKSHAVPTLLRAIDAERGEIELDFLGRLSTEAACRWLEKLPGVSASMAAGVLSFSSLKKPLLAVDDETARVVRRLHLCEPGAPASALPRQVAERAPSTWRAGQFAQLGDGLRRLGRQACGHGRPDCERCPLADLCPSQHQRAADIIPFPGKKYARHSETPRQLPLTDQSA